MRLKSTSSEHELATPVSSHLGVRLPATPALPSSPRALTVVSARKLEKTGAQLRDNRRSAKNDCNMRRKPIIAATAESRVPVCCCELEGPTKFAMDLNLGALPLLRITTVETFTTIDELHRVIDHGHSLLHTTGEQQLVQEKSS